MIYPTEPECVDYKDSEFRVWQNGENWWVANVAGVGEWSGATREIVERSAKDAIDESDE